MILHAIRKPVCLFLLMLPLVIVPCIAFSGEAETDALYASLPEEQAELVRTAKGETGYQLNKGLQALSENVSQTAGKIVQEELRMSAGLLAISLISSLATAFIGAGSMIGSHAVHTAAVASIILVGAQRVHSALGQVTELLENLRVFAGALLPAMTAAGTAAGNGGAALAKQSAAVIFANLMITVFVKIFLPLTYATLTLRAVGILSQNSFFARFSSFLRNTSGMLIRVSLTLYLGYLSVSGLIGSAADTLAKKTAKTALSIGIPIVGGSISEATESVFAGAAVICNVLGTFGLIALLSCAVFPLLSTGISYLSLRAAAALAQNMPDHPGREAIDAVADAVSMAFAMAAGAVVAILISVILCMKSAGI